MIQTNDNIHDAKMNLIKDLITIVLKEKSNDKK